MNPINRKTGEPVKVRRVRSDKLNSKGRNKRAQYDRKRVSAPVEPFSVWDVSDVA